MKAGRAINKCMFCYGSMGLGQEEQDEPETQGHLFCQAHLRHSIRPSPVDEPLRPEERQGKRG